MKIHKDGATWQVIAKHIANRRKKLLAELQSVNLKHEETQVLRGRLAELSELEGLASEDLDQTPASHSGETYGLSD